MVYETLLLIGVFGFTAMVLMGMVHGHGHGDGHGSNGGHGAHGAHDFGHGGHHGTAVAHNGGHGAAHHVAAPTNGGAHGTHHGAHSEGTQHGPKFGKSLFAISPLDLFSMALGAGATGMALQQLLSGVPLGLAAAGGAFVFDFLIIKPIISFIFKFSSKPSAGLEGTVAAPAEAMCTFDSIGRGVVKVTLDGEIVQLLARLEESELAAGILVKKGDQVVITEVDAHKGSCRVTRELNA